MKLLVGLGNPGKSYQDTLHNTGSKALERLAERFDSCWVNRFKGFTFQGQLKGRSFILLRPQTYMNLSGESVLACRQFFKIELEDILVLTDDIDLSAGKLRYRRNGGHGGHNGIRSIIQLNGGNDFHRLKYGIGRPNGKKDVADHVLSQPESGIAVLIEEAIESSIPYQLDFIQDIPIQIQDGSK
ncbi:MAG: aminoacyl-tRNA hydrolase [Deltaproteobacteria bacterium]|nr:aminoacyl-tRNA hydrolase [Deltaproteobacteria bacterium]